MKKQKVHLIAAARPNFMKVAPLWHILQESQDFEPVLIHTGQHYDANMSDEILNDLELGEPDHHLGIGSGTHAEQTGGVMVAYERIALLDRPDWVVVVGDVNSTLAGALVGAKLGLKVIHLEAGLRSRDRRMPEEINRIATDVLADVLWTPSPDADENLAAEGVPKERVTRVGNIMLDSFERTRPRIEGSREPARIGLEGKPFVLATFHRPSNVDEIGPLSALVEALEAIQKDIPIVFPVHPRTAAKLVSFGLRDRLETAGVRLLEPLPYARFMSLVLDAKALLTDSGGVQEETTYLGIPCLTLRENTERPITITQGTNRLSRAERLHSDLRDARATAHSPARPEFWDGQTAARCLADLRRRMRATRRES